MKKRIISFLLAMVLVLGLIPATATTANAYSTRGVSEKAIDILRSSETFFANVTGGGKIGYGTPTSYKYLNTITKEDAIDLMRDYIEDVLDVKINKFTKDYNIDLTQYEHDALVINIYRGADSDKVFNAIRAIKTVNSAADRAAIVQAFVDSRAHDRSLDETLKPTLNLSLAEASMYLYGDYGYNADSKLGYVRLISNATGVSDKVLGYVKADGLELPKASDFGGLSDSQFLGWFIYNGTTATGAPIIKLNKDHSGHVITAKKAIPDSGVAGGYTINTKTLSDLNVYSYNGTFAQTGVKLKNNSSFDVYYEFLDSDDVKWINGAGKNADNDPVSGWVKFGKLEAAGPGGDKVIASATVTSSTLKVYPGATSVGAAHIAELSKNDVVNVYEIKVEKTETGNKNWGKIDFKYAGTRYVGWINLANCDVNETLGESGKPEGKTGKIANAENVNIRSAKVLTEGIKTTNLIASLKRGTSVTVLEMNDDRSWAKIKWSEPSNGYTEGWVYMHYVQMDDAYAGSSADSTTSEVAKYTGVVNSNTLNVRKSADIYSTKVDTLSYGTKVNVYETKTSRNMKWGKIGSGRWVCLTYLNLTEVQQSAAGSATTTTTSTQATVTSTVLNVLKNYNNNAEVVGTLKKGDVVTILEKNTESTGTGSRIWGRFYNGTVAGWINLAYVELKTVTSVSGGSTGTTASTTSSNGASAVIANCISVNIREGAGVSNAQITKLKNGTVVKVYDRVTKDGAPWAKITWENGTKSGWVCMNYVEMAAAGTTGTTTEGGLVNGTNSNTISATGTVNSNIDLNVRSIAGLSGIKLGALKKGTRVTVYEQVSADGMIWGRIPYGNGSGWICMSYISIESASSTGKGIMGTVARCFAAVNVRSAPGTNNALINKIAVGTRVEVFETKQHGTQLWGRVAQGWVCMDYILLDSELPPGTALDATVPTTAPTQATEPQETINKDNEVGYTIAASLAANKEINVYNDADVDSDRVGTIKSGASALNLKVLALKQNGAELWGRVDEYATAGWIRMDLVSYSVEGYVNTDEQPVYANADTTSTVKENLTINYRFGKEATADEAAITKLSVNGETVYGWVASANGWIPMGRISNEPMDVIPTITTKTNDVFAGPVVGTTNAKVTAYKAIDDNGIACYLKSGVTVYVGEIRIEAGIVWGKIAYTKDGVETAAWINMASVNYTLVGTVSGTQKVYDVKAVNEENELNPVTGTVTLCELSFDAYGNLWGKVTGNSDATVNGGYIVVCTFGADGNPGEVFVATSVKY